MSRFIFIIIAVIMAVSLSCGPAVTEPEPAETPAPTEEALARGSIMVYSFTNEVPIMCDMYKEQHPEFGWEIETNYISTADGLYEPALDAALAAGEADIYCAESMFVTKYTQGEMSGYAMPYENLGIDPAAGTEAAGTQKYIIDAGTRPDGKVVALGYQSTAGAFIYRRSIAKDVWGTDDPGVIKTKIGPGWDRFFDAAEELKEKGYAIVSGAGDIWHSIDSSADNGWVAQGKLYIDPKREAFLDYAKELADNGYSNDTQDWSEEWFVDMAGEGPKPVLGFFGPAWLINYVMDENCGDTYGDWAICEPTAPFFWGGTWVLAGKGLEKDSAKKAAVAKLIDWITLDRTEGGLQYAYANGLIDNGYGTGGTKDTVASDTVMEMSDGTLPFLGGQDMFDVFVPAGRDINGGGITEYDVTIGYIWRDIARLYARGEFTREEAIAEFKREVNEQLGFDAR